MRLSPYDRWLTTPPEPRGRMVNVPAFEVVWTRPDGSEADREEYDTREEAERVVAEWPAEDDEPGITVHIEETTREEWHADQA